MKATGIVRKVDELGRIVLPIELRRTLDIMEKDSIEVFLDGKLIVLRNGLEVSADAIFCDVVEHSTDYQASTLSKELASLSPEAQKRILQMVELMIRQEKENPR